MPRGLEAEHAHLAEQEADAAAGGEVAAVLGDDVAHRGDGARRVVGRGLHQQRDAVRRIALVEYLAGSWPRPGPAARLIAASTLSLGMLTARAFWMIRRSVGLAAGSGPPDLTAMVMSFAMRANCFAMRFHRANIVCLRTSKMRPMARYGEAGRASRRPKQSRRILSAHGVAS